jgi:hypothetical protein
MQDSAGGRERFKKTCPREKETLIQEYVDFIENSDLLIADGQYTEEEYPSKVG